MLNVKREQSATSRETLDEYAAVRWPVMGEKVAVQIVGGCQRTGDLEGEAGEDDEEKEEDEELEDECD